MTTLPSRTVSSVGSPAVKSYSIVYLMEGANDPAAVGMPVVDDETSADADMPAAEDETPAADDTPDNDSLHDDIEDTPTVNCTEACFDVPMLPDAGLLSPSGWIGWACGTS